MAPPAGSRARRIPTISWDSVVDAPPIVSAEPIETTDTASTETASTETASTSSPSIGSSFMGGVDLAPLRLDLNAPVAVAPQPAPAPTPTPSIDEERSAEPQEPVTVRTTPPAVIVPALGDVTSGPDLLTPAPATDEVPEIQEATPHLASSAPQLPFVPAPVQPVPMVSSYQFDVAPVALPQTQRPRRSNKGGGTKLVVTLILLAGLVAAGVVYGQPYLFPSGWDDAAAPYAEAVETVRGVGIAEPVEIIAEPSSEFGSRLVQQLAATSPEELAQWRALGLASGGVDDATLARQLSGWQDVVYSGDTQQIHHDLGVAGAELDAQLVLAMAAAALDQEFGWSATQSQRTLDAAAATSAEVLRQAREIQAASTFNATIAAAPTERIDALPPVIGYQLLAPHVFVEFAEVNADSDTNADTNALADLVSLGPLGDEVPALAPAPTLADGDVVVGSPTAEDRSFWFLVFASRLDAAAAFAASEAIVENSLTNATRGTTSCVYATFSGSGVDETGVLRTALTDWAALAPPESGATFATLPDGSLQLSSCDPGAGVVAPVRTGVVAELVAFRSLELATAAAVAGQGGGDAEFAYVWNLIAVSNMPSDVAAIAAGSAPNEIARAAIDSVDAFYSLAG